jgi:hypothetical protein
VRTAAFYVALSVLTVAAVIGLGVATGIVPSAPITAIPLGSSMVPGGARRAQ